MPDLDALAAASLVAGGEDPDRGPHSGSPACHNCGAPLGGPYCGACGQRDQPLRIPLHRFLGQALVEFFGIDGRVWRTLGALLFTPGTLTKAFLSGRRQRYLRPLRVYLSTTLLFFFLLSVLDPAGRLEGALVSDRAAILDSTVTAARYLAFLDEAEADLRAREAEATSTIDSLSARIDTVGLGQASAAADSSDAEEALENELERAIESLGDLTGSWGARRRAWQRDQLAAFPPDSLIRPGDLAEAAELVVGSGFSGTITGPEWLTESRSLERLRNARTTDQRADAAANLARSSISKIPVVLFLLLPVFASLLKLLYIRRGWYYSEHLVLGLHTHAFTFVVFTAIALLLAAFPEDGWYTGTGWAGTVSNILLLIVLPLYYLVTIKRVYGQGWVRSVVKTGSLILVYSVVLTAAGATLALLLAALSG